MIIEKKFTTEREMHQWLENPTNLDKLKRKYPPKKFSGKMNLIDKQIEINEKP